MKTPCEIATRYVLPSVRALVAKRLLDDYGLAQTEVAKLLGTSQSNISYYLHSKRGAKLLDEISGFANADVGTIASWLASDEVGPERLQSKYCEICKNMRRKGVVCKVHRKQEKVARDCDICLRTSI